MVKILHCADLHLDSKMESNLTKEQAKERKQELVRTFENMVAYAAGHGARAILIAGDLFDRSHVARRVKNRVIEQIMLHPEIDFLYLKGNHDSEDLTGEDEKKPNNLKTFSNDRWTTYEYGNVTVTGMETGGVEEIPYGSLILNPHKVNIVMLHGQISEYRGAKTDIISLPDLKNHYIDYLALGHIHKYERGSLDERGTWCYSGCPEGRGFDECGEKGFVMLTAGGESEKMAGTAANNLDGSGRFKESDDKAATPANNLDAGGAVNENAGAADYGARAAYDTGAAHNAKEALTLRDEFVPFASRQFHEVRVDVTGTEGILATSDVIGRMRKSAENIPGKDLVKFVLEGETGLDTDIDTRRIEDEFSDRFYFMKIYDETRVRVDYGMFKNDRSLKGEFVRLMEEQPVEREYRDRIIEIGLKALRGEEIDL